MHRPNSKYLILFAFIAVFSALLFHSKAAAMPLVPEDSLMIVHIGDTLFVDNNLKPSCMLSYWDLFTIQHKDSINFQCAEPFKFPDIPRHPFRCYFTPATIGVHYDTVSYKLEYYTKGYCVGTPTWYAGPIPLAYIAVPDSAIKVLPTDLETLRMHYDEVQHRYISMNKCGLRFTNHVNEKTTFSLKTIVDSANLGYSVSLKFDSVLGSTISLDKNSGQYILNTSFISGIMDPVPQGTLVNFKVQCDILNPGVDSSVNISGIFLFLPIDSGVAVIVGDTVSYKNFELFPSPPCPINFTPSKDIYPDNLIISNKSDSSFHYICNSGQMFYDILTPMTIGLHRDTVSFNVVYALYGNFSCKGSTWGSGPIPVVYHSIRGPLGEVNRLDDKNIYDCYYDEAHSTYRCDEKFDFMLRNNTDKELTYDFTINPVGINDQVLLLFDSTGLGRVTMNPTPYKQWVSAKAAIGSMLPFTKDSLVNFTIKAHAFTNGFDSNFTVKGGTFRFHLLDSGIAIPLGDNIAINDTIRSLTSLVNTTYRPLTITYHDSVNFHLFFDKTSKQVVIDYTPQTLGIHRDTVVIEGFGQKGQFFEVNSGPLPLVYHGVPATEGVSITSRTEIASPTIAMRDSKLVIGFELTTASSVTLAISDITGREIQSFVAEKKYESGQHQIEFSPRTLTSGAYFLTFKTTEGTKVVPFSYVR